MAARSHVTHDTPNALWRKAQNQRRWSASRLHIPFLPKPQRALETPENSRGASAPAKSARAAGAKALSAPRACGRQGALRLRRTGLGAGGEPGGAGPRGHPALPSLALPAGRGAPEPGSRSRESANKAQVACWNLGPNETNRAGGKPIISKVSLPLPRPPSPGILRSRGAAHFAFLTGSNPLGRACLPQ